MRFYLLSLFILIFITSASFGQNTTFDQNKTDGIQLSTKSLEAEAFVEIFPNPTIEFLNISIQNSDLKNVEIEIYNIIGNKLNFELDQINSTSYKANVEDFNSGYYLIVIKDPIKRFNKAYKFHKQ